MITKRKKKLSPEEMKRIDDLLSAARNFHYTSFSLAGLALAISSLEKIENLSLSTFNVIFPSLQSIIGIYLLVIIFTLVADRLYMMAYPWLDLDMRRPQFAWIALSKNHKNMFSVILWLTIPLIICALATLNILIKLSENDFTSSGFAFVSVFIVMVAHSIGDYWQLVQERRDHRGGSVTFSMYLLYWIRIIRPLFSVMIFILPVIALIPNWRQFITIFLGYSFSAVVVMQLISVIGGIPFVYRMIDKLGGKLGFPTKSKHYT